MCLGERGLLTVLQLFLHLGLGGNQLVQLLLFRLGNGLVLNSLPVVCGQSLRFRLQLNFRSLHL